MLSVKSAIIKDLIDQYFESTTVIIDIYKLKIHPSSELITQLYFFLK